MPSPSNPVSPVKLEQPLNKEMAQPLTSEQVAQKEIERKRALLAKVIAGRQSILVEKGKVRPKGDTPLNPNTKYIWANVNPQRLVMLKALGYSICKDINVTTDWAKEDGTHVFGDLILMEIDRELWEANKLYSQMRAVEGVEGEEVFKAFAERAGIPVQIA